MKNKRLFCLLSFFILISLIIGGCEYDVILSELTGSSPADSGYSDLSDKEGNSSQSSVSFEQSELTVSYIDVGQGDAALIECGDSTMLIDAGLYKERYTVISYLKSRGVESLDYCVATHPHADHVGAMAEVIYNFDTDTLVYPACQSDSSTWNYVLDACDERDVSYFNPKPGDTFTLGEAEVAVLSPEPNAVYSDLNDCSLVLKLEYEDVSFMFTGDAESPVETALVQSGYDLSADVLKCGHHGSSSSSSYEFVKAVNPSAAVISCGKDNEYGHPHDETLDTLNQLGIEIYRTDLSSTVVALTDGDTITFKSGDEILGNTSGNTESHSTAATVSYEYIGNKNSKIFHSPDCGSVSQMKDKNKVNFGTRQEAVNEGYTPCQACNP